MSFSTRRSRKTLDYLDRLALGYASKRRARKSIARKFRDLEKEQGKAFVKAAGWESSPFPFNMAPKNVRKLCAVGDSAEFPEVNSQVPVVAVVGRSNVGKSSLLNALLGYNSSFTQKCAVSDKPGQTQTIDFYSIGTGNFKKDVIDDSNAHDGKEKRKGVKSIIFSDLPGYGFAFMNPEKHEASKHLMNSYLLGSLDVPVSNSLKRVLLLLDARHGVKAADIAFFKALHDAYISLSNDDDEGQHHKVTTVTSLDDNTNNLVRKRKIRLPWKLQIVLTKCDLVERHELAQRVLDIQDSLSDGWLQRFDSNLPIMCTSLARPGPSFRGNANLKCVSVRSRYAGVVQLQQQLSSLIPGRGKLWSKKLRKTATPSGDETKEITMRTRENNKVPGAKSRRPQQQMRCGFDLREKAGRVGSGSSF